jgi:hypothetical protein
MVLMFTMILIGTVATIDLGVLGDSLWSDVIGSMAFITAIFFIIAWVKNSQTLAEWALLGAFFIWGFRFWGIVFVQGWHTLALEGWYLSLLWMILAGGSWLLERSDPNALVENRGAKWTRH